MAAGGENVFDVVQELLNIGTPAVYGIAPPVDFNGLLSLKWLLGIAVNAIDSNDVARMKLMGVYCVIAEVLHELLTPLHNACKISHWTAPERGWTKLVDTCEVTGHP